MTVLIIIGSWLAAATVVGLVLARVLAYRANDYPPVNPEPTAPLTKNTAGSRSQGG